MAAISAVAAAIFVISASSHKPRRQRRPVSRPLAAPPATSGAASATSPATAPTVTTSERHERTRLTVVAELAAVVAQRVLREDGARNVEPGASRRGWWKGAAAVSVGERRGRGSGAREGRERRRRCRRRRRRRRRQGREQC